MVSELEKKELKKLTVPRSKVSLKCSVNKSRKRLKLVRKKD